MTIRIAAVVLLCASLAMAKPATRPAGDKPTSKPAAQGLSKAPATHPSTTRAFPTPAELVEKIKRLQQEKAKLPKVAYFNLSKTIQEKPAGFSLFGEADAITLHSLLERLNEAKQEQGIRAVLITLGDTGINLAQAQEVRDALTQLRKAGKQTFVYADSYDMASYVLASGAQHVCMLEGGDVMLPGVGLEAMFARGLLDKVGVQADYIQIGEYKGADEELTRTGPTEQLRGELNKIIDSLYEQIVDAISASRNLPREQVKQVIDEAMLTAEQAKERGLVDELVDQDGLRDLIAKQLGEEEIDLIHDYGRPERETVDLSNPFGLLSLLTRKTEVSDKPAVAIIYAQGIIADGDEDSLFGGGTNSEAMRKAFRTATRDENIKAIVLRIDSPGGSALASEAIWQAARRAAKDKPLIVSIGGMAASGGYYLASAGERIYADPTAIVGSIGVVGGKFVLKDLFGKIGLNTEAFHRGQNADLFSSTQPFTEHQRTLVTNWMKHTYEQFTQRVMSTRGGTIKDIDQVARGRIFLAKQAKDLGMVDVIGGTEAAIAYAAEKGGLNAGEYDVRVVPQPKTLGDLLSGGNETRMPFEPKVSVAPDSVLRTLSPGARRMVGEQIQVFQLLQKRPVMLVSPYVLSVR